MPCTGIRLEVGSNGDKTANITIPPPMLNAADKKDVKKLNTIIDIATKFEIPSGR